MRVIASGIARRVIPGDVSLLRLCMDQWRASGVWPECLKTNMLRIPSSTVVPDAVRVDLSRKAFFT